MVLKDLKKLNIPDTPGCYFFRLGDEILYIGKATSLRSRVKSYFGGDLVNTRGSHIVDMVFRSDNIVWEETDTVLEALILEAELIRKRKPYYNTKEKDDKSFLCVCITDEAFPMVLSVRKKDIDFKTKTCTISKLKNKKYKLKYIFGPFTSGPALKEGLRIVRRIFPYFDTVSIKKDNREFYKQLGLTPDVAYFDSASPQKNYQRDVEQNTVSDMQKQYAKNIRHIVLFFKGKKKEIIRLLEREMHLYAKSLEFEKAETIKRKIFALNHINDIALIRRDDYDLPADMRRLRIEAYDIAHTSGTDMVGVMTVVEGNMSVPSAYKMFKIKTVHGSNDPAALYEILTRRFSHVEWGLPDLVVVDGNKVQIAVAEKVLKQATHIIPVCAVVKDHHHKARSLLGDPSIVEKNKRAIVLANSEAHRFSVSYHKKVRSKNFIKKK